MGGPDISEWLDMCSDTVDVYPWASQDVTGKPTYSGTKSIDAAPCHIEMRNHLIVDATGREILAKGKVTMATTVVPGVKDKVVLPSEYIPVSPPILAVNVVPDDTGTHHVVLEIG